MRGEGRGLHRRQCGREQLRAGDELRQPAGSRRLALPMLRGHALTALVLALVLGCAPAWAQTTNQLFMTGAASGSEPSITANGVDSNISILLTPKGTGGVGISTGFDPNFSGGISYLYGNSVKSVIGIGFNRAGLFLGNAAYGSEYGAGGIFWPAYYNASGSPPVTLITAYASGGVNHPGWIVMGGVSASGGNVPNQTNYAATGLTLVNSVSTGNATNPDMVFTTGVKGSSGTAQATPTTALTLKGETQNALFAGAVGIGTTAPSSPLQVIGTSTFSTANPGGIVITKYQSAGGYDDFEITDGSGGGSNAIAFQNDGHGITINTLSVSSDLGAVVGAFGAAYGATANELWLDADSSSTYITSMKYASSPYPPLYVSAPSIYFNTKSGAAWGDGYPSGSYGTTAMAITSTGSVGIGTTTPGSLLTLSSGSSDPVVSFNTNGSTRSSFRAEHS